MRDRLQSCCQLTPARILFENKLPQSLHHLHQLRDLPLQPRYPFLDRLHRLWAVHIQIAAEGIPENLAGRITGGLTQLHQPVIQGVGNPAAHYRELAFHRCKPR